MSKILIIGGSGYLGSNLFLFLKNQLGNNIYSTYSKPKDALPFEIKLDVTNKDAICSVMKKIKPEIVVHAAAITDSNYCVTHKKSAWEVNVIGTQNVVDSVTEIGARLIYLSTDQVFPGNKSYSTEEDEPSPICYYGRTKLMAERIVASSCKNYCIARTSPVYGISYTDKKAFFDNFFENLLKDKPIKLFTDEYRSPIFLDNYCEILSELIRRHNLQGLYNICGFERLSRYELGVHTANALSKGKHLLLAVTTGDLKFIDKRPLDCSMSNKIANSILETTIIRIQKSLKIIKRNLKLS